jgi:hypothetical protein
MASSISERREALVPLPYLGELLEFREKEMSHTVSRTHTGTHTKTHIRSIAPQKSLRAPQTPLIDSVEFYRRPYPNSDSAHTHLSTSKSSETKMGQPCRQHIWTHESDGLTAVRLMVLLKYSDGCHLKFPMGVEFV